MKKVLLSALTLLLLFSVIACSRQEELTVEEKLIQEESISGERLIQEESVRVEIFERFSFRCGDTELTPGDKYLESLFPEVKDLEQTPDCRTNRTATVYYYDGFNIQTVYEKNELTGEITAPFISCIEVTGPVDAEGTLQIGDSMDKMLDLYGAGYEEAFGGYEYFDKDHFTNLTIYYGEDGKVRFLVYSLDESLMLQDEGLTQEEIASLLAIGKPLENYGITFEGIGIKRAFSGKETFSEEDYDFVSDVKAFDKYGNELEVSYTMYMPPLTSDYNFGPQFYVFTATDSEGNTATEYQSCYIENWTEKDEEVIARYAENCKDMTLQELKNYIRNTIPFAQTYQAAFSSPVSTGDEYHSGNCYVHARMLIELLNYMGYDTHIIWDVTNRHFWCLVKTENGWRHLDGTPLPQYTEDEGLMTDEERLVDHSDRYWDTAVWPAAQ